MALSKEGEGSAPGMQQALTLRLEGRGSGRGLLLRSICGVFVCFLHIPSLTQRTSTPSLILLELHVHSWSHKSTKIQSTTRRRPPAMTDGETWWRERLWRALREFEEL